MKTGTKVLLGVGGLVGAGLAAWGLAEWRSDTVRRRAEVQRMAEAARIAASTPITGGVLHGIASGFGCGGCRGRI